MQRNHVSAKRYKGGNDRMDALLAAYWQDDCIWIVNGPAGRRPVNAGSREEAIDYYVNKFKSLH